MSQNKVSRNHPTGVNPFGDTYKQSLVSKKRPRSLNFGAGLATCLLGAMMLQPGSIALAQNSGQPEKTSPSPSQEQQAPDLSLPPVDLKSLPRNLFVDQKNFWATPFHMSQSQWQWTVPVAIASAALLASDTAVEKHVPTNPSTLSHAVTASNAGVAALAGVGGVMFLWGHAANNDQERETGLLSGEAAIDAVIDAEVFKYTFGRERPFTGDGKGDFFRGKDSFPSEHAAASWAIASVIAHEYPGTLTQILAYGMAGAVSAARIAGQKHFLTDAAAGSAIGWYLGRQAYRSHSRYSPAEVARYGTFRKDEDVDLSNRQGNLGSPNIPLDSWIYPAMERLIALGYIHSAILGMRPWTRMECARMLKDEAASAIRNREFEDEGAEKIYTALAAEFEDETARFDGNSNLGLNLDEVYTRITGISGAPLRDGFHFGQTIVNDYGRPYAEGFNNVTGITSHAVAGPLSFYLRAEYQHAPPGAELSAAAAQAIAEKDFVPAPPTTAPPAVNQVDLLEGYVGMQLDNWQITFGKQSLWWGADQSGPMLFSTNATPILMLQINRVKPFHLPLLGDTRLNYLVGRITGYHWVNGPLGVIGSWTQTLSDEPFIVGEKVSFKPSQNLEVGISVTSLFGGPGVPATLHNLLQAGFSSGNGSPGTSGDPGDRRGGLDFSYRIPGIEDGLTFYVDAFADDEPNPLFAWNKTALTSGLYLPRFPRLSKLELRVEGVYTDPPGGSATVQNGFFYHNDRFLSGYTNDGNLIGSWIGREGQGAEAWATYWLNPKNKVQFNFRHQKVSQQFIPDGGTLTDVGVSGDYWVRSNLGISAKVQYERWLFPVIQLNESKNISATVEVLFTPTRLFRH